MALTINQKWIQKLTLLEHCEEGLKLEIAFLLQANIFPPGECCPPGRMYIINKVRSSH